MPRSGIEVITLKPDAILAASAMFGLVFVPVLGTLGALMFLISGCALLIRRWRMQLGLCIRFWPIILLPVFCMVSAIWSEYPIVSFRFGVQFMATVLIAITIAATISARAFGQVLFGLYSLAMLASVLVGDVRNDTGAWLGIYGSKNALAGAAATYVIVCVAQFLDSRASYRHRLLAVLGSLVGVMLLLLAQSISALVLLPPSLFILCSLLILYRLSYSQRIVTVAFATLVAALLVVLVTIFSDMLVAMLLQTTGKDVTLTGRTELWQIALGLIAERPWLGMGYQAFWVHGHSPAEALWFRFGIESRSGFNFHNTYLSNMVEIGAIGVLLQTMVLFGAASMTGLWALRTHRAEASLLFILVMMVVMISFVEVPIFFQFSLRTVIVICAFVFAFHGLEALRQKPLRKRSPTPVFRHQPVDH
ncbi:MAG: O-antigen ligase family protein [Pseudomonadota bacterium]